MKRNKYKILIIFVVALFILVPGIVFAAKIVESSKVSYDNSKTGLPNNVQGAIDTLYSRQNVDLRYWKQKYYEKVSENLENVSLVAYIKGRLKNDETTILQDDGTAGHNMRYIGAEPSNWISFNGELWRIIGVFGTDSHGQSDDLIKIQYSGTLGKIQWDENNKNDWAQASLNKYLNEGDYYNTTLDTDAKSMIQTVDWRLGAAVFKQEIMFAYEFYKSERGSIGVASNPSLLELQGNVALAYPSDYIFSTNGGVKYNRSTCLTSPARNVDNSESELWRVDGNNAGECAIGSWMIQQIVKHKNHAWTLMACSDRSASMFAISSGGTTGIIIGPTANDTGRNVFPSVYLKSNIICTNCFDSNVGTEDNPFKIKLG